jgi:hypothetical protein
MSIFANPCYIKAVLRVRTPHWLQCGFGSASGSSIFNQCGTGTGSGSRILMTKNIKKICSLIKKCNLLILDLHKRRPSYRRSLHPTKKCCGSVTCWYRSRSGSAPLTDGCGSDSGSCRFRQRPSRWQLKLFFF